MGRGCTLLLPYPDPLPARGAQEAVEGVLAGWGERLAAEGGGEGWGTGQPWGALFGDVLMRRLILRFLLCRAALALHTAHSADTRLQPTCFPALPEARPPLLCLRWRPRVRSLCPAGERCELRCRIARVRSVCEKRLVGCWRSRRWAGLLARG